MIRLLAGWQNGDGTIEWDDFRTIADDWYRGGELLGYMVYTEQFAGNLEGVREHLEYLRELGVNYLHLMPLLESPEGKSDGGYAVSDFWKVEPALGTMEDLGNLSDACHRKGIWVGICGELGADRELTDQFLRMGVDELSVNPKSVLKVRKVVRGLDLSLPEKVEEENFH